MTSLRFALALSLVAGCTSASEPIVLGSMDSGPDTRVAADTEGSDAAVPADTYVPATDTEPLPDTATPDDVAVDAPPDTPPPMPVDCFSGSFGPSTGTLVDFLYQVQVG